MLHPRGSAFHHSEAGWPSGQPGLEAGDEMTSPPVCFYYQNPSF